MFSLISKEEQYGEQDNMRGVIFIAVLSRPTLTVNKISVISAVYPVTNVKVVIG